MKKKNWVDAPELIQALKLCEEAGEVAKEFTEAHQRGREVDRKKLNNELNHVEHLVAMLRRRFEV